MTADAAPLVDSHFHVYTTDMPLAAGAWHKPPEDATIEQMIATLDGAGVTFGVIAAASLYGDYNDYMLEALRRHERLRATAIVRPTIDRHELEALDREGFVGIRFQFRRVANPPDLTSPEYRMLLRRVADLGWHVHLNDDGRRIVLQASQQRKEDEVSHRLLDQKMPIGLVPYIQARLLARHLRGDLEEYPPYLSR